VSSPSQLDGAHMKHTRVCPLNLGLTWSHEIYSSDPTAVRPTPSLAPPRLTPNSTCRGHVGTGLLLSPLNRGP
jgi:hypothetical protein